MTREEMLNLIQEIAQNYDLDDIAYEYGIDLTEPENYSDDELGEVINAWADGRKCFEV